MSTTKHPSSVVSSSFVRLRRLSKRSLKHWTREMKRAAKDMRSGDERNARDSVVWLTGYLKAMDDLEDSAAHDNPAPVGSAWLARDSTAILGTYSLCLFRRKPQISNAGFWEAKKGHGRWPVDLPIDVKPGDCIRLEICKPNAENQARESSGLNATPAP